MVARYDKYDPYDGGFRAPTSFAVDAADKNTAFAVGLNAAGQLVKGAGNTGVKGICIGHNVRAIADILDTMTDGEIVGLDPAVFVSGTNFYGTAAGLINTVNTGTYLGHTVEAGRLIVRAAR